ncbi:chorismate mutase [Falseniella ignava]|uniref:Chorismate mutase n=1 Tax=Falseniella ignava CCUG 37419 TaxID=883112 RepID=K1LVP3_9LACT|nr:chorismate mutase [Falseniella ignava]EKB59026.1 chorismate mutase [Falseniella ignava CCUG 37419]
MLEQQRQQIDQIDRELVRLFEARMHVVQEVAQIKSKHHLPILDAQREKQVITKVQGYLANSEFEHALADFYTELMRISRQHQQQWIDQN